MTEKRFTLTFDDKIVDNLTGIIHDVHSGYDVAMDLSGLLNELNDENEELKQREKTLESMIRTFDEGCKEIYDDKCRLEKENEQLRKKIAKTEKIKQQRDFYYARLQRIIKIANGDFE